MNCPVCRAEVRLDDPHMPFCSERCRQVDLGKWASGEYVIPGEPSQPAAGEEAPDE